ncbi:MAG TPA: CHAP domain-containing protein [Streptosporangiaceae bacterium]|nr:CHAP domain-containing protein [Streptosporangiaceae bacterium]
MRKCLLLMAAVSAVAGTLLVTPAATASAAAAQPAVKKTVYLSHSSYIVSNYSHLFASAEVGWSGSGAGSYGVVRARSGAPGPWEDFGLDYVHDWNPSAPANEVYIYSYAARNYVSAEFGWSGNDFGILHARPGSTTPGPWETFYITHNSDGTVSFSVYDFNSGPYYVSAEEGWTGNSYGILRARATSIGPWEKFQVNSRFIAGYDDYPAAWKNPARDSFANLWGFNRECVSFAAWKIYENSGGKQVPTGENVPSDWATYSIDVNDNYGDAGNWAAYARSAGVPVNGTPTPGSIAQWNFGSDSGQFPVGHVAYVTAVFPDGSVDLAQYNLRDDGLFSTLHLPAHSGAWDTSNGHSPFWVPWPDNFIHINGF